MHSQSRGCTLADVFFSPLFWVLFTQTIAGLLSERMRSNEGSKHFTGRITVLLLTTQLRLIKITLLFLLLCFYIYIYIDYFSMSVLIFFVLLFIVQVSKVMGVQRCVYLLSPSVVLSCFSHDVHGCVFVFLSLPSRRESLPPVLHFHQSVPFSCLSVTPSHSSSRPLFPHITSLNQ